MDTMLLTVPEVARELRISDRHVWRMLADGTLSAVRIGRAVRVRRDAVAAFVEANDGR